MKPYTSTNPTFSDEITIVEPTDPAHADNINRAPMQLLENTLKNKADIKTLLDLENKAIFETPAKRENIKSGETIKTVLGKIARIFADIKNVAFSGSYNDLDNKPTAVDVGAVATSNVLTTKEEVKANTNTENIANAIAVKELNADLENALNQINSNLKDKMSTVTILSISDRDVGTEYMPDYDARNFVYFIPIMNWKYLPVVAKSWFNDTYDYIECSGIITGTDAAEIRIIQLLINRLTGEIKIGKYNQVYFQSGLILFENSNTVSAVGLIGIKT